MEKDTVCIGIQEYLELQNIREKVLNSNQYVCRYDIVSGHHRFWWFTESDAVKTLITKNNENSSIFDFEKKCLNGTIKSLESKIDELKERLQKFEENTFNDGSSGNKKPWWKIF